MHFSDKIVTKNCSLTVAYFFFKTHFKRLLEYSIYFCINHFSLRFFLPDSRRDETLIHCLPPIPRTTQHFTTFDKARHSLLLLLFNVTMLMALFFLTPCTYGLLLSRTLNGIPSMSDIKRVNCISKIKYQTSHTCIQHVDICIVCTDCR